MSSMTPSAIFSFFLLMFILAGFVYLGANTELIYDRTSTISAVIVEPVVETPPVIEKHVVKEIPVIPVKEIPTAPTVEPDNETTCLSIVAQLFSNLDPTPEELDEIERELKENNCGNN